MHKLHKILSSKGCHFSVAKEWIEDKNIVLQKSIQLAKIIKSAKYPIVFTGAGCSTSLGIPDYRSGNQTVVGTGPGIWNRSLQSVPPKLRIDQIVDKAVPSLTHMAIKTLLDKGIFKYLVSQNTDGLHIKSGVSFNKISQLHGNRNLEKCVECNRKYFRDFRTINRQLKAFTNSNAESKRNHQTGRLCQNCGGKLIDSIIYFGQKLSAQQLTKSFQHAASCDFLLCIGSSLTVRPSSNVPVLALKNNALLSIINIQQTPFDSMSKLKINAFCDEVMNKVMQQLGIAIDQYTAEHYLEIRLNNENGQNVLQIQGKDKDGENYTFIKSAVCHNKQFLPTGHKLSIAIEPNTPQVDLNFYDPKPSLSLFLLNYFKIFHGEPIKLKISKKVNAQNWSIQQQ